MTRLILHAGTQKTGTTAIQAFAERHRAALLERGLLYPDLAPYPGRAPHPHHLLTRAVSVRVEALGEAEIAAVVRRWREEADRRGAAVLFSAERLYRRLVRSDRPGDWFAQRRRYLERIAAIFAGFDVEAVLVFRQPDDFVRSAFQESVAKSDGGAPWTSFPEFREGLLKTRLLYVRNAEMFGEIFPKLTLMTFDELVAEGSLAQNFFGRLGIDVSGLAEEGVVRRSVTPAETMARLFLLNAGGIRDRRKTAKFLASRRLRRMLDEQLGPDPFGVWESAAARADFVRRVEGEVEELRRRHFPDRETLFPRLGAGATPPPVPDLPPALTKVLIENA